MGYYIKRKLSEKEYYLSLANRPLRPDSFSKYRGVVKNSGKLPYRAQLSYQGKRFYLGTFETELQAALAYNKAALAIIGPHALINTFHNEQLLKSDSSVRPSQEINHRTKEGSHQEGDL
jgi:hypothetical protein